MSMWIGELIGRLLWAIEEPYLRFVGAMLTTGLGIAVVLRETWHLPMRRAHPPAPRPVPSLGFDATSQSRSGVVPAPQVPNTSELSNDNVTDTHRTAARVHF